MVVGVFVFGGDGVGGSGGDTNCNGAAGGCGVLGRVGGDGVFGGGGDGVFASGGDEVLVSGGEVFGGVEIAGICRDCSNAASRIVGRGGGPAPPESVVGNLGSLFPENQSNSSTASS